MCRKSNAFKTQASFADVGELYHVDHVTREKAMQFSDAFNRGCEVCCLRKRAYHFTVKDVVIFPDSQFLFLRPHQWSTFRERGRLSVMVLDSRILSLMAQTVFHLLLFSSLVINAEHLMMAKYQILPKLVILFVFSCPTSNARW